MCIIIYPLQWWHIHKNYFCFYYCLGLFLSLKEKLHCNSLEGHQALIFVVMQILCMRNIVHSHQAADLKMHQYGSLHFINAILWGLFFDFVVGIDITWLRLFSYPYGIVFKISISFSTQDSSIDFSWFVHIMNNNLSFKLMLKATQMQIIIRITKFINTLELCTTAICVSRTAL